MNKRYVSYFQSVVTVGIMKSAKNKKEAEKKSKDEICGKDILEGGLCHCSFSQTPFKLTSSEEWHPEIETSLTENGLGWKFCPNDNTRKIIAKKLDKSLESLTDEDVGMFLKSTVEQSLK